MQDELELRLRKHVTALAGRIGERNVGRPGTLAAAAQYIRTEWQAQGHAVSTQHCYTMGTEPCDNLEVAVAGAAPARGCIVVGAHYDTVPDSPGADDNASGVAALIEIARLLAGSRPARQVRLVAFVNEEPPFFLSGRMGSRIYARAARARGEVIDFMISLEMLGCYSERPASQAYPPLLRFFYPDRGNFIAFVSNLVSRGALRRLVGAFRSECDFPCEALAAPAIVPGIAWSDQLSFWREGYRALMVTDTAFYRYAHYHSAHDTPDRLDYRAMARVVGGLAKALSVIPDGV